MAVRRESISMPTSSAGILGITPGLTIGGWKLDPRGVVVFTALFIIVVKVLGHIVR